MCCECHFRCRLPDFMDQKIAWETPAKFPLKCYLYYIIIINYIVNRTSSHLKRDSLRDRALELARSGAILRAKDFYAAGVPHTYLRRLQDDGLILRIGRGIYQYADADITASHSLAVVSKAIPHGVICLLSALQFHVLTTQVPHRVWVLIEHGRWTPLSPPVSLRIIRSSSEALSVGLECHWIEGVSVPITIPAKTVADCFKHRNKVGTDIAIEALKECLSRKEATVDEIWRFAEINRVASVMRPYFEAIV